MDNPDEQLSAHRARIDQVDELLSQLLIARSQVISDVAKLKAKHWPNSCHIRPAREGQMHRDVVQRFRGTEFSPRTGLAMWRQLIGGSTHMESPLNVTYLNPYPEHRFMAREYFGVQIGARHAPTFTDALEDIRNGSSNILILPHPESHAWWRDYSSFHSTGLRVFASLPVETGILPKDCTPAIAMATVNPEDSGDDISYFVTQDGGLEIVDRFVTERSGATFIGAHAHPITLRSGV